MTARARIERRIVRITALAAGSLAMLAALASNPYATRSGLDVASLARSVQREEDHVTAVELAHWIKDRRPGLRVLDVRPASDFDEYHVPGAERMGIESITGTKFDSDETIVIYSGGGAHAAQAWVLLRATGHQNVYFLRGGVEEWLEDIMNPSLPADASAADRAEFTQIADLGRYFGGVPRMTPATGAERTSVDSSLATTGASAASIAALKLRTRRRGC